MATAGKKTTAKKPTTKKTNAKNVATKKSTARKKAGPRTYSKAAGENVRKEIEAMKAGKLRSGGSGKKVTDRKQAIAIGLSEARRAGKTVPKSPSKTATKKR